MIGGIVRCSTAMTTSSSTSLRPIDPEVLSYLDDEPTASAEYRALEATRFGVQLAFGILYLGVPLVVLLSAIWLGISLANRLVAPIRRLIDAAKQVSQGNLAVRVPARGSDGDLGALGETFNTMTAQLRGQRAELLAASEQIDSRRRFTEAVLSGRHRRRHRHRRRTGASPSPTAAALRLLGIGEDVGRSAGRSREVLPRTRRRSWTARAATSAPEHRDQISIIRDGRERTVNVRVTTERSDGQRPRLCRHPRRHHRPGRRAAQLGLGRRRPPHRPRDQEPADADPALGRAPAPPLRQGDHRGPRGLRPVHRHDHPPGRRHRPHGRRVLVLRPHAEAGASRCATCPKSIREAVFLLEVGHPDIAFTVDLPEEPLIGPLRRPADGPGADQRRQERHRGDRRGAGRAARREPHRGHRPPRTTIRSSSTSIDNGIGLPRENRQRLLEPYMTTREKGTGLGLAIVTKIVEDHGGRIELLDSPEVATGGRGAMIRITLPRIRRRRTQAADSPTAVGRRLNRQSIDHGVGHPDRRRRSRHPGTRLRHPLGRGPRHPDGSRCRFGARRDRQAPAVAGLPRHLAAGQPDGRAGAPRRDQARACRPAGGHDLRPRQHRDRRLGDQARRLRLHREAVQEPTGSGAGRRAGAGGLEAPPRGQGAARAGRRGRASSSASRRR